MRFALLPTVAVVLAGCSLLPDRPPKRDGFCVYAFYACEKCGSVEGGISQKGPYKRFSGPGRGWCRHEWTEIPRSRFEELATERYGVDWSADPMPFWNHDWHHDETTAGETRKDATDALDLD